MSDTPSDERPRLGLSIFAKLIPAARCPSISRSSVDWLRNFSSGFRLLTLLLFTVLLAGCAAYGPYHANTSGQAFNSVRGPQDERYKLAFIEFGDQGSMLDPSQLGAALQVIGKAERPLLFVYIHGWQNNAVSRDVCRFEHFIDTMSRFPEMTERKINVIGVYIAWRGRDLTVPGLNFLTFWSRKSAGQIVASQNGCLAAISELALAARAPDKKYHHCVLLGHSFGGLVLGNTISHSILDAGSNGVRNSSPWDMAVTFNSADSSIGSRQLIAELNYLYKYDERQHAYVARTSLEKGVVIEENHPFLIMLQSENDQATGAYFPIGTGVYNTLNLRFHWDKVSVPGRHGQKISEQKFYTRTPGNNPYLVNYHVVPLGETTAPPDLRAQENRAFEANIRQNVQDGTFYTSERNDGHENRFCRNGLYSPDEVRPSTANEVWRRWQFVYSGNARVPCWVVRVPKDIIWGHGGLWSDNSIAMLGALFRMHFPLEGGRIVLPPPRPNVPARPDLQELNQE